jgi:hypothetical protein
MIVKVRNPRLDYCALLKGKVVITPRLESQADDLGNRFFVCLFHMAKFFDMNRRRMGDRK